jgi:hypothetical protein
MCPPTTSAARALDTFSVGDASLSRRLAFDLRRRWRWRGDRNAIAVAATKRRRVVGTFLERVGPCAPAIGNRKQRSNDESTEDKGERAYTCTSSPRIGNTSVHGPSSSLHRDDGVDRNAWLNCGLCLRLQLTPVTFADLTQIGAPMHFDRRRGGRGRERVGSNATGSSVHSPQGVLTSTSRRQAEPPVGASPRDGRQSDRCCRSSRNRDRRVLDPGEPSSLIVEASDSERLARGMQLLFSAIVFEANRVMKRSRRVFRERHHRQALTSRTQLRRALVMDPRAAAI